MGAPAATFPKRGKERDSTGGRPVGVSFFVWDRNGFWLFYKRLEQGRLIFPKIENEAIELTRDQMNWLLSGLDYSKQLTLPKINPTNFY